MLLIEVLYTVLLNNIVLCVKKQLPVCRFETTWVSKWQNFH